MKYTYQYKALPTTDQKLEINLWLRICQYWYNRQLGERFDWWERNRTSVNCCPLVCHLPELRDRPNYYSQKKLLPGLKKGGVTVEWSGEDLDFSRVPANTLQQVCQRVDKAFERFTRSDASGHRSGKPRFKSQSRYRSFVLEGAGLDLHSCSIGGKFLYLKVPKLGLLKVRYHRPLPDGAILKQVQLIKKNDGWFVNLRLDDPTVPTISPDQFIPTWENSLGMDAVLHEDHYIATSEGVKLPSVKLLRRNQAKLAKTAKKKNARTSRQQSTSETGKTRRTATPKDCSCQKRFPIQNRSQVGEDGQKSLLS
ncbi:transposase [Moorena sp. SIOASIH]|uniref:RNA-guided endonuclease InsQ/TnpB family protein n=1 Tax=Moorena sp. SIOASIH TaxID=2607817 RepID=UPI0025FBD341|nr:transposase [Moorena sp. SIOASIH]